MADDKIRVPHQKRHTAAQALEVLNALIKIPVRRQGYAAAVGHVAKQNEFDDFRNDANNGLPAPLRHADYNNIPPGALAALEQLTDEQLRGLSDLDTAFVAADLFVEVQGSPGMLFYH